MRLYLSSHSYDTESLATFYGPRPKIGLIANALDFLSYVQRASAVLSMSGALHEIGAVTEIDLRRYFRRPEGLRETLDLVDALWLPGGSRFLLVAALQYSGATEPIASRVRDGAINYAGSSAGAVVASSNLLPATTCEDSKIVSQCYQKDPVFSGLGLLNSTVIPHFIEGPIDGVLPTYLMRDYCLVEGIDFITIADGSALVIEGDNVTELVFPVQETAPALAL